MSESQPLEFILITGLSGAGKTQAIRAFEDLGYFCVDNLPPLLIPRFAELCRQGGRTRAAVVVDVRGGEFFERTAQALEELERLGIPYRILFLEADDATLIRRFQETRRRHPLARDGRVQEAIAEERRLLEGLRGCAHWILDTSGWTPHDLRRRIFGLFAGDERRPALHVTVVSFGYKYGLPEDADLVFDARFLPNPHYVPSLKDRCGTDPAVREYVLKWSITREFLQRVQGLLDFLIPHYLNEGRAQLTVAVGCTGGRHRSVVLAQELARHLRGRVPAVTVVHRDVDRPDARPEGGVDGLDDRPAAGEGP